MRLLHRDATNFFQNMEINSVFHGFWYRFQNESFKSAELLFKELNDKLTEKEYLTLFQLDVILFSFQNPEAIKSRVRPTYHAVRDMAKDPDEPFSRMALIYEIPLPESEFIQVPEEDLPTYIGKAILKVIEAQNVPIKIRKQFDKDRFVADVRSFFVNEKGCEL